VAVYSKVIEVPINRTRFIHPPTPNTDFKVTAVAVKGPSFFMYFGTKDSQGMPVRTGEVLTDTANLRTEIYLTQDDYIVFDNGSSRHLYGFYSAVDH
jgi:hypothetical protein